MKVCHWNLNGIAADNYIKISLLKAYNTVYKSDVLCISENYLNSSSSLYDERLKMDGYGVLRLDHPSDTKRGCVAIYYKEHLPLKRRDDLENTM